MSLLYSAGLGASAIPDADGKYVADDISGSNGDSVTSWSPTVGSISLDGGSPTLDTNALNNRNVLVGNGTDDVLEATASLASNDALTVYVVTEPARDSESSYILGNNIGSGDGSDTLPAVTTKFNNPLEYFNGSNTTAYTATDDGYAIVGFIRDESSGSVLGRYNGSNAFDIAPGSPPSTDYVMSVFNESGLNDSATAANAGVAEIRVFDRALNQDEYQTVENDLSEIYGIPLA
jgi:hypothetical protein